VGSIAVDDFEAERKLLLHLLLPLAPERSRAQDQDSPDAAAQDKLGQDKARFDSLAQADIVRQQQSDAGHSERF
jgi:hypothetical protein